MSTLKFKLTNNTKTFWGGTLFQIEALIDIPRWDVKKGDKGGWVEKESNLEQDGDAWVSGNAWVYGDARVSGNAWVSGNALVSGNARVYGNALVSGNAWVSGNALVYGDALVSGDARVSGNARVSGDQYKTHNSERRVPPNSPPRILIQYTNKGVNNEHTKVQTHKQH